MSGQLNTPRSDFLYEHAKGLLNNDKIERTCKQSIRRLKALLPFLQNACSKMTQEQRDEICALLKSIVHHEKERLERERRERWNRSPINPFNIKRKEYLANRES